MSSHKFKVVFDVGANVGQSLYRISHAFPYADIYCFEPILSTFNQLRENTSKMTRVQCFHLALGSSSGTTQVVLQNSSLINSLVRTIRESSHKDLNIETVHIDTLDRFCDRHNVEHIDYLKIDTEGFDLEVLKGGNQMLACGRVTFIQVEAGISYTNKEHIPLQQFRQYLEEKGYHLFGIYEQTLEWTGELRLMFCNPVFVLTRS
jgi:FkbM family methyltransferase